MPTEILRVEDTRSCQLVADEVDIESLVCVKELAPRLTVHLQICPRIVQVRGSTIFENWFLGTHIRAFTAICIEYMRLDKAWWPTQ